MSNSVEFIDDLLSTFDKEIDTHTLTSDGNTHTKHCSSKNTTCNKLKNGTNHSKQSCSNNNTCNNTDNTSVSSTSETVIKTEQEAKAEQEEEEEKKALNEQELDELSEEEALRLAMEMSMNEDDRRLVHCIQKEIKEAQAHLSNWFSGNFASVRDKNCAWCDFCRRLHHQFEMYRIDQGVIQPLSYQFFIQFIALMYGTMKKTRRSDELSLDQHKIRNIVILAGDDDAIKYLRFAQGVSRTELSTAVYAKFESLALDPMAPNEWKYNHVMFIPSQKAPNGLLWTKWHMQ
eukprot:107150_1